MTLNKKVFEKLLLLSRLAVMRPREFYDRVTTIADVRYEKLFGRSRDLAVCTQPDELIESFSKELGSPFLRENDLLTIENEVLQTNDTISGEGPFNFIHNADIAFARYCYWVCRTLKPEIVIETGVAYGISTAFILQAMSVNDKGILHSVDLPPLGQDADRWVGILVPERLKPRWRLHRGSSKRTLPDLLKKIDKVDIFMHDSLHTYRNMKREFEMIWPHLRTGGVIIADDVDENRAFEELQCKGVKFWAVAKEEQKNSMFGVLIKS